MPRPAHWGGYAVEPDAWEFWVGHDGRLHERFVYRRTDKGWSFTLLAP
ncbi:pyridoxine 5'-phosphate oxidase C-terminal domain-containing protein [Nannocystis pusilla]